MNLCRAFHYSKKETKMIELTKTGEESLRLQLAELKAKRKEILDVGLDTAIDTPLPTIEDIRSEINEFEDEDGDYVNAWGVTENYDIPISLHRGKDFIGYEELSPEVLQKYKGKEIECKSYNNGTETVDIVLRDGRWILAEESKYLNKRKTIRNPVFDGLSKMVGKKVTVEDIIKDREPGRHWLKLTIKTTTYLAV